MARRCVALDRKWKKFEKNGAWHRLVEESSSNYTNWYEWRRI